MYVVVCGCCQLCCACQCFCFCVFCGVGVASVAAYVLLFNGVVKCVVHVVG